MKETNYIKPEAYVFELDTKSIMLAGSPTANTTSTNTIDDGTTILDGKDGDFDEEE